MKHLIFFVRMRLSLILIVFLFLHAKPVPQEDARILSHIIDPGTTELSFYLKDDNGQLLQSIQNLKSFVESKQKTLLFAMNGGMYKPDHSPQGLFIQHGITLTPLDTTSGGGNFYLKPNGVFYLTKDKKAAICNTLDFKHHEEIRFATQSGPMLIIDDKIHPAFKKGSTNLNIRNGVGILPNGQVLFAVSKEAVNFYDFAMFFKNKGCKNALYLDGFVSRTYLPAKKWEQLDGSFGVIIGVTQ